MELEIKPAENLLIDPELGIITMRPLPRSLKLLQTVDLQSQCHSVCYHNRNLYCALDNNTLTKITWDSKESKEICTFSNTAQAIARYKDSFYILVSGKPCEVHVHSIAGKFITKWVHPDKNPYNGLAMLSDKVVIPDRLNNCLAVYTLTGNVVKQIPYPQKNKDRVAICATGNYAVIVSVYLMNKVFKVDITTGQVVWSHEQIEMPEGVACYEHNVVLVASYNSSKITLLCTRTGRQLFIFF